MALKIKISNLNKKRRIEKKKIEKISRGVFRSFKKKNALIDITFVSNSRIKKLNKKYMKRNSETDVLSFSLGEKDFVGDVYISSDKAYQNAKRFGTSLKEEIFLYTIHGVLHLAGFGDKTKKEKSIIRKLEKRFLKKYLR